MSKKKKEHIAIAVFRDGHCYGASEPMWFSEAMEAVGEGLENGVDGCVIDLNSIFDGKPCFFRYVADEAE